MKLLLIGLAVGLLVGCTTQANAATPVPYQYSIDWEERYITQIHINDAAVTCWVYKAYSAGGISCLPDAQVKR